jgi:tetratricopeptide (TPR) repeat protein
VKVSVRELFSEIVDLPPAERQAILNGPGISTEVRGEVESLLEYDAQHSGVTRRVSEALKEAFCQSLELPRCGPYRLVRLIGTGGMGSVYLARREDGEIDQQVAIKLLRADVDRPAWRERFLRERQVLASLNHPCIARLMDAGHTAGGQPYLVMEFVEGLPVDEYAKTLDLRSGLELFIQLCEAVSHAHRHSIIHRDLKPSNILVDPAGRPKLLDFGIAKVLSETTDHTRTVDRLLTPNYASPEQRSGGVQTVATDIYSLGAVLYKLLTGRAHREATEDEPAAGWDESLLAPSRLKPDLPGDLDYIVLKALRDEPSKRYVSAEALADDIRLLLDSRPVSARRGDTAYRIGSFLRRNRATAAGFALGIASLCVTTAIANHQRGTAESRIEQGHRLASKVLALNEAGGDLYGPPKAGYELVSLSKDYLEGLSSKARGDHGIALELGRAYSLLARAQGITLAAPASQAAKAKASLLKAGTLVEPVLRFRPGDREALLSAATISHDLMVIAETERRKDEALAKAGKAVEHLERILEIGGLSAAQAETVCDSFYQIAVTHKNLNQFEDGIRFSRRSIEISRSLPEGGFRSSRGLSILADLLRLTGDVEGALQAIAEARTALRHASFPNESVRRFTWFTILWREGKIWGAVNGLGLNRPAEAIPLLEEAFRLLEEWARSDSAGAWSSLLYATVGRELGELLRPEFPQRALSVYQISLLRLREIGDNREARRGEVVMRAGSAYALRRLGRTEEAGRQIEAAFQMLRNLGDYPSESGSPNATVESALRALGDHLAETGHPGSAAEVFEDLLARTKRSKPDSRNNLRHAVAIAQIYADLSAFYRSDRQPDRAAALAARRIALWRDWDRKLPRNILIQRQLELATAPQN